MLDTACIYRTYQIEKPIDQVDLSDYLRKFIS